MRSRSLRSNHMRRDCGARMTGRSRSAIRSVVWQPGISRRSVRSRPGAALSPPRRCPSAAGRSKLFHLAAPFACPQRPLDDEPNACDIGACSACDSPSESVSSRRVKALACFDPPRAGFGLDSGCAPGSFVHLPPALSVTASRSDAWSSLVLRSSRGSCCGRSANRYARGCRRVTDVTARASRSGSISVTSPCTSRTRPSS